MSYIEEFEKEFLAKFDASQDEADLSRWVTEVRNGGAAGS